MWAPPWREGMPAGFTQVNMGLAAVRLAKYAIWMQDWDDGCWV